MLVLVSCRNAQEVDTQKAIDYRYASLAPQNADNETYKRVAVDASVYAGLMAMLGVEECCLDFSDSMHPDIERMAAKKPDLLMFSDYEGADLSKYERLGVPIVRCKDFMESSALARAEWMRYFGRLWGVGEKADSLFDVVEAQYNSLKSDVADIENRPTVFFDLKYGNAWYQPAEQSTLGMIVHDAGGRLPFETKQKGGSVILSDEQMLLQARDADFWIIRYGDSSTLTREKLARISPLYSKFKVFRTGNIYVSNVYESHFYEETPFRPDWLLEDMRNILSSNHNPLSLRYFRRIE